MFRTRNIQPDAQFSGIATPFVTNAMPTRPVRHGLRNLTGLYLGVEGDRSVSPPRVTPGMARGRGMPSRRIKTPTEQRRYRKVELLRTREEKRGFSGNPLKSNQEALNSLLPMRKLAQENPNRIPPDYQPTGFCVKSYRNPHKAEILATFPDRDAPNSQTRPRTVTGISQRAFVPSPYFFKSYNSPATALDRYTPYSEESPIAGAPGTGKVSRSVSRGRQHPSPRSSLTPVDLDALQQAKPSSAENLKRNEPPLDLKKEDLQDSQERVAISVPQAEHYATDRTQPAQTPTEEQDKQTNDVDMMDHVNSPGSKLEKSASGSEIIIGVENEVGEPTPVDIDDTDDQLEDEIASNGSVRRKVSISGRILKSKNSEEQVAQLHQEAENRKKHLEELLDEHAQIVHEVEVAIETEATTENTEDKENNATIVATEL